MRVVAQLLPHLRVAALAALLTAPASAHGGKYGIPPNVTPPGPAPLRRDTGRPPGPSGPGGGAQRPPAGPASNGVVQGVDLTRWQYWWQYNQNRLLAIRPRTLPAAGLLRPTQEDLFVRVLPALQQTLDATTQRHVNVACILAMARIGQDHPEFRLLDVFRRCLTHQEQAVIETAALAIGVAGIEGAEELELLIGLGLDNDVGRKASNGQVRHRTRTFALYGLALLAHRSTSIAIKQQALATFQRVLTERGMWDRNVKVACITGIGLLNVRGQSQAEQLLRKTALDTLTRYFLRHRGIGVTIIQAHCPLAMARLVGRSGREGPRIRGILAAELDGSRRPQRRGVWVAQSAALALGQLVPEEGAADDLAAADCRLLLETYHNHPDPQTRNFALISLGTIGGETNRARLLEELRMAQGTASLPWCALALGIQAHAANERQRAAGRKVKPDARAATALLEAMKRTEDADAQGALAIGLGLTRSKEATPELRERLMRKQTRDELAANLASGLALLGDRSAIRELEQALKNSPRRFLLREMSAVALHKLGRRDLHDELLGLLPGDPQNLSRLAAVSAAMGWVGDRRFVQPMIEILRDAGGTDLARALAADALGMMADKNPRGWNAAISVNLNYCAAVETLTDGASGLLDYR